MLVVVCKWSWKNLQNENLGFNAATGEYVDMFEAGIVDPAKVERVAMQKCCFSCIFIINYWSYSNR